MKKLLILLATFSSLTYAAETTSVYTLDNTHSFVEFNYNHFGYSNPSGKWLANGTINLDDKDVAKSKVDITIQVESIVTGVPALDHHLLSADFFDAEKYPTATFVSSKITDVKHKGKSFKLVGDLTLHGVTKPVTLDVVANEHKPNPMSQRDTIGYSATGLIKRSDFGLGMFVPAVSDDVKLNIQLEARLPKPQTK